MQPGDRVLYMPPTLAGRQRVGVIRAVSGRSACVQFDDCDWPQWAPLERLLLLLPDQDGYAQIALFIT
ncbi:MAG TPA: hypothetical protein PKA43_00025 [Candidatus Competibacter phosphatis]|nr:hypothetical protein [Candidatus Competibacter phosphatis]